MTVFVDPQLPVPILQQSVYHGHVVVLTNLPSVQEFGDYTKDQLLDLFKPYDPEYADEHIDAAEMAKVLGRGSPASSTRRRRRTSSATSSGRPG